MSTDPGMSASSSKPAFRVMVGELLYVEWKRRHRTRTGRLIEDIRHLGFNLDVIAEFAGESKVVFPAVEELGPGWGCWEFLIAGYDGAKLPRVAHPDFLNLRQPEVGELFDSAGPLLWLAPGAMVPIDGMFALSLFGERHGQVIGSLQEALEAAAFEKTLDLLLGEFNWELEGNAGTRLVEVLTGVVAGADLLHAEESIIHDLAVRVSDVLIAELGPEVGHGWPGEEA